MPVSHTLGLFTATQWRYTEWPQLFTKMYKIYVSAIRVIVDTVTCYAIVNATFTLASLTCAVMVCGKAVRMWRDIRTQPCLYRFYIPRNKELYS
jgi:hypothetical protein